MMLPNFGELMLRFSYCVRSGEEAVVVVARDIEVLS